MQARFGWLLLAAWLGLGCGDDPDGDGGDDAQAGDGDGDGDGGDGGGVGVPCEGAPMRSGEATYYDFADGSGNCGFPATPDDLNVAAINAPDYAGSASCGSCVRVTGPKGTIDLRIVDQCPECPSGDLDLSPSAFEQIADLSAGRVPITWETISCPVSGPIVYHFKDGSNPWWTAIQIRNHAQPIDTLEYQADGAWVEVPRVDYNYFVQESGMGEGPLSLRVTDVLGNVLEDSGIPVLDDADAEGQAQFPACGG